MADINAKSEPGQEGAKPAESALQIPTRFSLDPHSKNNKNKKSRTSKPKKAKKPSHHPYYEDNDQEDSDEEQEAKPVDEHKHKEKEANIIVHEKHPNLASVLTYHEEVAYGAERHFANNLDEAFSPCRILMVSLFRFPLQLTVKRDFSREFAYSWKSFRGWMFFITAGLICLNVLLISVSLGAILLDFPQQPEKGYVTNWTDKGLEPGEVHRSQKQLRIQELFLLQRNFVPMILLVLSLAHICTGDASLFFRRTFIAKYFTFWDEAVEIMKMDVAKYPHDVKQYMFRITMFYLGYLILLVGLCAGRIAPVATGAPTQLVILWARPFYPPIHAWDHLHYFRFVGVAVYIYLLMCSKIYILLLLFKCKILNNAYATWNERLESVIRRGKKDKKSRLEHCRKRTGFDHLFRDYVVLLDLLRGADTMFTNIIESYFGTQVFSLCFEIYYFLRTFTGNDEFLQVRRLDGVIIGIYLTHSIIMLVLATNASAQVGEVAMEGLEIIRRNGCIGRKSNDEMYFTLSLYMSYTGHFKTELQGGKFVTFDRSFIVALCGAIFTYYIILSQFTPPLALKDPNKLELINQDHLIRHVESTNQLFGNGYKVGF